VSFTRVTHFNTANLHLFRFDSQRLSLKDVGYVKLVFPTLLHLWQVYIVRLTVSNGDIPLMHFHVPWSHEDLYNLISLRDPSSPATVLNKALHRALRLKLHRPAIDTTAAASLELFLNPRLSYTLQIDSSLWDILSQLVRYYMFLLPTFLFTVLCICVALQINDCRLRTFDTLLAWQVHLPVAGLVFLLYQLLIQFCPQSTFTINLYNNGYYFSLLPLILYAVAMSFWALIALIVDQCIFQVLRSTLSPIANLLVVELNRQTNIMWALQRLLLALPFVSMAICGGANGHIALFFLVVGHTLWRGTINRRLRELLTTLLFFHGLLVILNLTGFIIHLRSIFVQGFLPLYLIMPDPSLISAFCASFVFCTRFTFDRTQSKRLITLRSVLQKHSLVICVLLALLSQVYCAYSIQYLWIFVCLVLFHSTILFFVPTHQA
jgi:hypothetical protein